MGYVDPAGLASYQFLDMDDSHAIAGKLTFAYLDDDDNVAWTRGFDDIDAWKKWFSSSRWFGTQEKMEGMAGYALANGGRRRFLDYSVDDLHGL